MRSAFNEWGRFTEGRFVDQQWLLAKWEVCEGVVWPAEKIDVMIDLITKRLDTGLNDRLVDLGCGGGWMLKRLAPECGYAVGLDFSAQMIGNALKIDAGDVLLQGEIGRLPFKDNSFDRALCYFVLINMMEDSDVERSIIDMMRILKPGGSLLIGQLPDKAKSKEYDAAKAQYREFCSQTYGLGADLRDVNRMPQKLFDIPALVSFLEKNDIHFTKMPSFNPFYRAGESSTVEWRLDFLLRK